ncbi:MAG: hypothetical protein AB7S74_05335 [Hyphomicrobium sp.]
MAKTICGQSPQPLLHEGFHAFLAIVRDDDIGFPSACAFVDVFAGIDRQLDAALFLKVRRQCVNEPAHLRCVDDGKAKGLRRCCLVGVRGRHQGKARSKPHHREADE